MKPVTPVTPQYVDTLVFYQGTPFTDDYRPSSALKPEDLLVFLTPYVSQKILEPMAVKEIFGVTEPTVGGCFNIKGLLSDFEQCDYLSFTCSVSDLNYFAFVEWLEIAGANNIRVHWRLDAWATYGLDYVKSGVSALVLRREAAKIEASKNYDYTSPVYTKEDFSVPQASLCINNLQEFTGLETINNDLSAEMGYAIFSTVDQNGNPLSDAVKLREIGGSPYYGCVYFAKDPLDISAWCKAYARTSGAFSHSQQSLLGETLKILYIPKILAMDDGTAVYERQDKLTFNMSLIYQKELSPQFLSGSLVCPNSGMKADFDLTNGSFKNGVFTLPIRYRYTSGSVPRVEIVIDTPDGTQKNNIKIVGTAPFPTLPYGVFVNEELTWVGLGKEVAGLGLSVGSVAAEGAFFAGGVGAAVGAAVGFGEKAIDLANKIGGYNGQNYTLAPSPSMPSVVLYDMRFELYLKSPTPEGTKILRDNLRLTGEAWNKETVIGSEGFWQVAGFLKGANMMPNRYFQEITRLLQSGFYQLENKKNGG